MSRPDSAEQLLVAVASAKPGLPSPRVLFLAAHPDDETLGASAILGRLSERTVVYLTDGAPRDPQFRKPHMHDPREAYAGMRANEAVLALSGVAIPPECILFLRGTDQEAIYQAERLLSTFVGTVLDVQPDVVVTHPYEGGHPDHDTAALIARLALDELQREGARVPLLVEFTSYHAVNGRRVSGEFLATANGVGSGNFSTVSRQRSGIESIARTEEVTIRLSAEERARKARMLGCYVSQWHVVSEFPLEPERLRVAPAYDFTKPPHPGALWYECLHWEMTGAKWRALATRLLAEERMAA